VSRRVKCLYEQAKRFVPVRARGVYFTFDCVAHRSAIVFPNESDDEDVELPENLPEFN